MDKNRIPQELRDLEQYLPKDKHQRETLLRFWEQMHVDDSALILLKGHLVIEEKLTAIIGKFVFHSEHLDVAKFSFFQKLAIARSMSLDEAENGVWKVVANINVLRNALAHSLKGEKRERATQNLRDIYSIECNGLSKLELEDDRVLVAGATTFCLGFLDTFEQEVERFKELVSELDEIMNQPHRKRKP